MIHAQVWHLLRMIGAFRVHSIHSHNSFLLCGVRLGEAARWAWWEGEKGRGTGEEGGVGSFFMLTKIIAVWSMTEESSLSIWMSIIAAIL